MQSNSDILVVGSGIAGLSFAIYLAKLRPDLQINILSKAAADYTNTHFAQGGVAVVTNQEKDSFAAHIHDTLQSGGGLSQPDIVKLVIEKAPERLAELIAYGVDFTRNEDGSLELGLEGGHSTPRVVHADDHTRENIQNTLLQVAQSIKNIEIFEYQFCYELLPSQEGGVKGLHAINMQTQEIDTFMSPLIVLASGGLGQVYAYTTNPAVATGDGLVLGLSIGAEVAHLNFIQFHPTAFFENGKTQLDLLTEAIRGFGGHVINQKGERFLFHYDKRGELATRDIVSNAVFNELKNSGATHVYLDCRHLEASAFEEKFPQITARLKAKGLNPTEDLIPIVPVAHYQCGGLKVDDKGQTNIPGLFAIGECAETGLHGVNRLASNSLLEGLVFAYETACFIAKNKQPEPIKDENYTPTQSLDTSKDQLFEEVIGKVKSLMSQRATIASDKNDLIFAEKQLAEIEQELKAFTSPNTISVKQITADNLCFVAQQIVKAKIAYLADKKHSMIAVSAQAS